MGLLSPDIERRRDYDTVERVALSGTTAKTAAFTVGKYYMLQADVAWHFKVGPQASVTAATTDFELGPYQPLFFFCSETARNGIAGILTAGSGFLYVAEIKAPA